MNGLLDYVQGDTVLHRLNPVTKMIMALCICVAAFLTDSIPVLVALLALDVFLGLLGGIPRKTFKLLLGLAKISLFLFILQILFVRSGTPLLLFITDDGLRVAATVVLRLIDATMPLALMLSITRMNDLTNALVQNAHLPYRYAFTLTTALRFIPVFTDEMRRITEAQTARGVDLDTGNPLRKARLIIPLCIPLLITSVKRSGQSALAAESRGFYLRTRSSASKRYLVGARDAMALCCMLALVVSTAVL